MQFLPAVVRPPVAGDGNELQEQLHAGQLVKDLCWFPVEPRWTVLDQELHHLNHLFAAVADRLAEASEKTEFVTSQRRCKKTAGQNHVKNPIEVCELQEHVFFVLSVPCSKVGSGLGRPPLCAAETASPAPP